MCVGRKIYNHRDAIQKSCAIFISTAMEKEELILKLSPLFQMDFDAKETIELIYINPVIPWSWGTEAIHASEQALLLHVQAHRHTGFILIALAWDDTYTVHLVSEDGEIIETMSEIYFDDLVAEIDKRIEWIEDYKQ